MSQIIPTDTCSGLTDRLAYQGAQILSTLSAIGLQGNGRMFPRSTAPQIYEVERDFITPARNWDQAVSGTVIFPQISQLVALVNAFTTHTQAEGGVTLDVYLTRSGLNVADTFAQMFEAVTSVQLTSTNVFSETDVPMGSVQQLISGINSWAFTDGSPLGTGSGSYSTTNHCAQQLLAYLGSGVTVSGDVTVTVTATKEDGSSAAKDVTFLSSDPANMHRAIGTTSDQFLDVTNITASGITNATPTIFVRQLRERVPGL